MNSPEINDLLQLPGPFTFKVIVKPTLIDQDGLLELSRKTLGHELVELKISKRASGKGSYVSYSLKMRMQNREEIDRLYRAYSSHDAVSYVL